GTLTGPVAITVQGANNIIRDNFAEGFRYGAWLRVGSDNSVLRGNSWEDTYQVIRYESTGIISSDNYPTAPNHTVTFAASDATPTVATGRTFITAGSTAITDFDDGVDGQIITVRAHGAITITDSANLQLQGDADFVMAADDTVTLANVGGTNWYETGRTVSAQTVFTGSTTHTFGSVGSWLTETHSVTCTGATAGMMVDVGLSSQGAATNPGFILLTGHVPTAGGSVLVSLVNTHGSPNVVGSGTLTVRAYSN
ncbi:MAG: hypothetical protein GY700_01820, partial [Propionibacteriaceae bacterium]|nr:hypothetical protein [Propionibacteriaceae bacterium]